MPMEPLGYFVYAVLVVLAWGSPLILLALWLGWKRRRLALAVVMIALAVPLLAGLGVAGMYVSGHVGAGISQASSDAADDHDDRIFGRGAPATALYGSDLGEATQGSRRYRRLGFGGVWPDDPGRTLELWLPAGDGTGPVLVKASRTSLPTATPAGPWLLLLRGTATRYSPYGEGRGFIADVFPALPMPGDGTAVVMHLDGTRRRVFIRPGTVEQPNIVWPSNPATLDLDSLAGSGR